MPSPSPFIRVPQCGYHWPVCLAVVMTLSACMPAVHMPGEPKDSAPSVKVSADSITNAIPRKDRITRAGNKNPYTVLGQTYHLLPTNKNYKERGIASWYGTKFQGRPTANGEKYNLYAMTAAHRTLKIPTYVKVTNLENGRTAIVRVNDRGPFHNNRVIDLSYAAAVKLGYAEKGIAKVEVEAIDVSTKPEPVGITAAATPTSSAIDSNDGSYFLQAGAFKSLARASKLSEQLRLELNRTVTIKTSEPAGYYRVHIGPLTQLNDVQQVSDQLLALGLGQPRLISQ